MLSTSVSSDKRTLDRLKPRTGSLPLKKRRVTLYQSQSPLGQSKDTFLPLKPELKSVTPEPAAAAATVGCLSMTRSGFCNKPCFKQFSYCKLHHLQREGSSSTTGGASATTSSSSIGDKRFTGAEGQIRCCATTTRGRACAYVAVLGTPLKYCHLHADYETNPSPRRDAKRDSVSSLTVTSSSPSSISQASPTSSDISLLSSMPTDKWKYQSVRIALGPLTGRIGVVEKWGNGWVSCSVDGVGLHNRRAFELQLVTNKQSPMTPITSKQPAINQVTPCSVADVAVIQVPEIRLSDEESSKTLSFRLSERSSGAFRNPL
jgi:hypothetical protein